MVLKLQNGQEMLSEKTKGHNYVKTESRFWFFFSAHRLIIPYICEKFNEEIFNGFKVIVRTRNIAV